MSPMILAQETTDVAADLVGTWTPFVLILAPFLIGLLTKVTTEENAKKGIAVVLGVGIAGLMLFLDPPTEFSSAVIMTRLMQSYPIVEASYRMWNLVLSTVSGRRLNEVSLPGVGIQIGDASRAGRDAWRESNQ